MRRLFYIRLSAFVCVVLGLAGVAGDIRLSGQTAVPQPDQFELEAVTRETHGESLNSFQPPSESQPATEAETIYFSEGTVVGAEFWPPIPGGWPFVATADFSQDGHPDYLLYNGTTRQTAIGYLNDNMLINAAPGPTLAAGWSLVGQ